MLEIKPICVGNQTGYVGNQADLFWKSSWIMLEIKFDYIEIEDRLCWKSS